MTRPILIGFCAAAVFSFFFVPTFVVVSHGLLQEAATPASIDEVETSAATLPVVPVIRPAVSTSTASTTIVASNSASSITMGGKRFTAEIADTDASRQQGLSNRTSLPASSVMLFVFSSPSNWGFWMKDTLIPLDMIWLDSTGKVVYIQQGVLPSTYPAIFAPPQSSPALYVIETNAGVAASIGLHVGSVVSLPNNLTAN